MRAVALTLVALMGCTYFRQSPRPAGELVGMTLDLTVKDLAGKDVRLGAGKGPVMVVDVWATWCAPCLRTMPVVQGWSKDMRDRGLVVYGIAVDQDRRRIEPYAQQLNIDYALLWDKGGEATSRALGIERLPTTLVVNGNGVIAGAVSGDHLDDLIALRPLIDRLLAEKGSSQQPPGAKEQEPPPRGTP